MNLSQCKNEAKLSKLMMKERPSGTSNQGLLKRLWNRGQNMSTNNLSFDDDDDDDSATINQ
jgi:hypothetical protein